MSLEHKSRERRDVDVSAQDSLVKRVTGLSLDELIEGYSFKGKQGELFIFDSGSHELKLTLETVRNELQSHTSRRGDARLREALRDIGITQLSFIMPLDSSSTEEARYWVTELDITRSLVTLSAWGTETKTLHISHLHGLQGRAIIKSIKTLERTLDELPLSQILRRLSDVCGQLFASSESSPYIAEALAPLFRIRLNLYNRAQADITALIELNEVELKQLQTELKYGAELAQAHQAQLVEALWKESARVGQICELKPELEVLSELNEDELIDLFDPVEIKRGVYEIIASASNRSELSAHLEDLLTLQRDHICHVTSARMLQSSGDAHAPQPSLTLESFIESIKRIQDHYINSQLRVGRLDLGLISRFRVTPREGRDTYPVLRSYEEVTRRERVALYRELRDHRLNLLFERGINEQYVRSLALYNVNDFYGLFYKLTDRGSKIV